MKQYLWVVKFLLCLKNYIDINILKNFKCFNTMFLLNYAFKRPGRYLTLK